MEVNLYLHGWKQNIIPWKKLLLLQYCMEAETKTWIYFQGSRKNSVEVMESMEAGGSNGRLLALVGVSGSPGRSLAEVGGSI